MLDSNAMWTANPAEGNLHSVRSARPLVVRVFGAIVALFGCLAAASSSSAEETEAPVWNHTEIEKQVVDLLAAGKQSAAEALLNKEVDHVPEVVEFATLIGAGRAKQKEAMEYLQDHAEQIRVGQRLFFLLGAVMRSRFDIVPAMQMFGTTYAMDSTTPSGECALCIVKLDSPRMKTAGAETVEEAFGELNKLADANPDDMIIRWMAAIECRSWHRNAESARHYQRILEKWNPGPSLLHQTYANLLDELRRHDDALVERNKTVEMEPAGWSYDGLANTLKHLHRFKEANAAHASAVKISPKRPLLWTNWAATLKANGEFDAAIEKCEEATGLEAIDRDGDAWRPWAIWGEALEAQGKLEPALEKYQEALLRQPDNPELKQAAVKLEKQLKD